MDGSGLSIGPYWCFFFWTSRSIAMTSSSRSSVPSSTGGCEDPEAASAAFDLRGLSFPGCEAVVGIGSGRNEDEEVPILSLIDGRDVVSDTVEVED